MQIQFHDVRSRETLLGQAGEEKFIDNTFPRDADPTLLFACRMGCHHHAARDAFRPYWHIRAVVEAPHYQTFRTVQEPVGGEVETGLNQRMIKYSVVFASHDEEEACQIGEHSPR